MHATIFVDTNVLLHYPPLDQIDWLELVGAEAVTLVIPAVVVRELNESKDHPSKGRLRKRAGAALGRLTYLLRRPDASPIRKSVVVEFLAKEPTLDFDREQLRSDLADDVLIAAAIQRKRTNRGENPVYVASADLGLELKLLGHPELCALALPKELMLAEEIDDEEKEKRSIQKELEALRSALPCVHVFQEGGETGTPVRLPDIEWMTQAPADESRLLERERVDHPYLTNYPAGHPSLRVVRASSSTVEGFNAYLRKYFTQVEQYISQVAEQRLWRSRMARLSLTIENTGGSPADELEVTLTIPSTLEVVRNPPSDPKKPQAPELVLQHGTLITKQASAHSLDDLVYRPSHQDDSREIEISKNEKGESVVVLRLVSLKHKRREELVIYIHFVEVTSIKPFQIMYTVWMRNHSVPSSGVLNVLIARKSSETNS